jgi:hypothetical protein
MLWNASFTRIEISPPKIREVPTEVRSFSTSRALKYTLNQLLAIGRRTVKLPFFFATTWRSFEVLTDAFHPTFALRGSLLPLALLCVSINV